MTNPDSTGRGAPDRGLGWAPPEPHAQQPANPWDVSAPRHDTAMTQRLEMIRLLARGQHDPQSRDPERADDPADEVEQPSRRDDEDILVRIQWTESTRYSADIYVNPNATDADLYTELSMLPEAMRHTYETTDTDTTITSITDLDGDGHPSVLERAISAGNTVSTIDPQDTDPQRVDWGDLADTIDTRLAEGPDWPALAATLDRAAAGGYDVTDRLPHLAAATPLPSRYPAQELQYRVLADTDTALAPPSDSDTAGADSGTRADPPSLADSAAPPPDRAPGR